MIITDNKVSLLEQKFCLSSAYQQAEYAGRICYNSTNRITNDSYKGFIKGLLANEHYSPLGHGAIYMIIPKAIRNYSIITVINILKHNFFTSIIITDKNYYITTNLRVLHENLLQDEIKLLTPFIGSPTQYHDLYYTFRVETSIGVTRELNRHATYLAICEQSTRWCNFSKKDGGEVYFIKPWFYETNREAAEVWKENCKESEESYMKLLELGNTPNVAREVLNLSTRTIVIYSAPKSKWEHVLKLRSPKCGAKNVHPDCAIIADKINDIIYE